MRDSYEINNVIFDSDNSADNLTKYNMVTVSVEEAIEIPKSISRFSKMYLEVPGKDPVKDAYDKKEQDEEEVDPTPTPEPEPGPSPEPEPEPGPSPEPEPDPEPEPEPEPPETDHPLVVFNDHLYGLYNGTSGINVDSDDATNSILVQIVENGTYELSGNGTNVTVTVMGSLTDVVIILNNLNINNTTFCNDTSSDVPVFNIMNMTNVVFDIYGRNTIAGPDSYYTNPASFIYGNDSNIEFNGDGTLSIIDNIEYDVTSLGAYPPNGIENNNGLIAFLSGIVNISTNGNAIIADTGHVHIDSGNVNITYAGRDGIRSVNGDIEITSGNLTIENCYGFGLNAMVSDRDIPVNGNVYIDGGVVVMTEMHSDGIRGENIDITDGSINIVTVFDNAATGFYKSGIAEIDANTEYKNDNVVTSRINVDTGCHAGIRAGTQAKTYSFEHVSDDDRWRYDEGTSYNKESSGILSIRGGIVTISTTDSGIKVNSLSSTGYEACSDGVYIIGSPDDAIKSYGEIDITGGIITIAASGDAIDCDNEVSIIGNTSITINTCYNAIEAKEVLIGEEDDEEYLPTIVVNANNSGIITNDRTVTYLYDDSSMLTNNYTLTTIYESLSDCQVNNSAITIKIDSQSTRYVSLRNGSSRDMTPIYYKPVGVGISIDGELTLSDGKVYVYGQSSGSNSPISVNGSFTASNRAMFIAAGVDNGDVNKPGLGDVAYITYGSEGSSQETSFRAGAAFSVKTMLDEVVYSGVLIYAGSFILFANPNIISGNTYKLTIGSMTTTATARSASI